MEYLQYLGSKFINGYRAKVLNLIINGIPSIQRQKKRGIVGMILNVLNLIINGIPSIHIHLKGLLVTYLVLNLIINGIPSIHCGR